MTYNVKGKLRRSKFVIVNKKENMIAKRRLKKCMSFERVIDCKKSKISIISAHVYKHRKYIIISERYNPFVHCSLSVIVEKK